MTDRNPSSPILAADDVRASQPTGRPRHAVADDDAWLQGTVMRTDRERFAELLHRERHTLIAHWREQVRGLPSAAHLDLPALEDHMPKLVDELIEMLAPTRDPEGAATAALAHGVERFDEGFDIEEVVAEYAILRTCIHDLAEHHWVRLQGPLFRIVHGVLDAAIARAVKAYVTRGASAEDRAGSDA